MRSVISTTMGRWSVLAVCSALAVSLGNGYAQADSTAASRTASGAAPKRIYIHLYASEALIEPRRQEIESHLAAGAQAAEASEIARAVHGAVDPKTVEEALERSDPAVSEAERRLRELDLEGALDALYWAAEEYATYLPELVLRDGSAERLIQVHLLQTLAYFLSGDEQAAASALRRALVLDPSIDYDPERFPPQLEQLVKRVVHEARQEGRGKLRIAAGPVAPVVYVNGREHGTTPIVVDELPAGTNLVHARLPGVKPLMATAEVSSRRRSKVSLSLEALPSKPEGPLAGTLDDAGRERATQALHQAARALEVDGLLLVVPRTTKLGVSLAAYVYDMRRGELVGRFEEALAGDGAQAARKLGRDAVLGARWRPLLDPVAVTNEPPIWKHKYFWPTVGAAAGAVLVGVVVMSNSGLSNGQKISLFSVMRY